MIISLQRRIAEIGRIRIGQQVPHGKGTRPAKLTTFRLTSPNRRRIEDAAKLYGGSIAPWQAPSGNQYEVITESDALAVVVPPAEMAFSQAYELWSAGGCQRRCDSQNEMISEGPCLCDPANRACDIHTRLSVMLADLPGLGVWRLDTQGYYAAAELSGAVDIIANAARRGELLPATLRLEQRMIKRANEQTKRFAVPVLDIEVSPAQLLGGRGLEPPTAILPRENGDREGLPAARALPAMIADYGSHNEYGSAAPLTPVPDEPSAPAASIAEQVAADEPKNRRGGRRAAPLPATGLAPRTVAEATQDLAGSRENAATASRQDHDPHRTPASPDLRDPASTTTALSPYDDPAQIGEPAIPATAAQLRKMHATFRDIDISDREDRLIITTHILGYRIATSADLTVVEASKIIDTIDHWKDDQVTAISDRIRDILNTASIQESQT